MNQNHTGLEINPIAIDMDSQSENQSNSSSILWDNHVDEEDVGLSSIRRHRILSRPIMNLWSSEHLHRAKYKLRGFLTWMYILKDLRNYGTGSQLIGVKEQYKNNIPNILKEKLRILKKISSINQAVSKWLFYPSSKIIQGWSIALLLMLRYTFIFTPWIIAFENLEIDSPLFIVELIADSFFFCDILVTLNTALPRKVR